MRIDVSDICNFVRLNFEQESCTDCGTVRIKGGIKRCCEGYQKTMLQYLPEPMLLNIKGTIENITNETNTSFPRALNKDLCLVIQNTKISLPNVNISIFLLSGISYAVDTWRQF
jgi:hypothetical protein